MVPRSASSLTRARFALGTVLPLSGLVKPTISGACLPPIAPARIRRPFGPCSRIGKQLPHAAKPPRRNWWPRPPPKRSIPPVAKSVSCVTDRRPRGCGSARRAAEPLIRCKPGATRRESGQIHRELLEIGERAVAESGLVRGPQDHPGRLARLHCFLPTRRTQAPTVTRPQTRKSEF